MFRFEDNKCDNVTIDEIRAFLVKAYDYLRLLLTPVILTLMGACHSSSPFIHPSLIKAGLQNALPQRASPDVHDDSMEEDERLRWVYGDVIFDAVQEVAKKHGWQDSYGVGLGMSAHDIFGWLGLEY